MFASESPVLQPGCKILVTGASGFVGSHVADQLLSAGYKVRGTTRDTAKNAWLVTLFETRYGVGSFELVSVPNLALDEALDAVLEDISGVVHAASDMTFDSDPNKVIPPMILATVTLAKAAAKRPNIKRFVFTSSCAAAASPVPGVWRWIGKDSWNDEAIAQAWAPPPYSPERGFSVYAASKTQCERELWRWYQESSPGFVLNTVLPSMNMGLSLDPANQGHPSTSGLIEAVYKGYIEATNGAAQYFYVDVQDNARLHVAALLHPQIKDERIFAYAAPYTWRDVQTKLSELYPNKSFVPEIEPSKLERSHIELAEKAEVLLKEMGREGWTSLEETLLANTRDLA
ncbi:aldehyde reductase protein [Pochonia chlamydosporia 170]|uniref:Aldehyde reductase protein n=1 Tax=Pochonia chlamydosporia 170 TaxID=1380566 RepID=A0A179FGG8_METCM|nr:aldehyde reductase protein [Pochonia chlamydosporia 170]OAQ64093.1 aldehyde reductase protein [Pochonia chlamydosporia 170]